MLAYSGRGRFVVQALSLNEIVREMAYLLTVSISKKVVIKYNFFPDLPSVLADATQIRQVVMNLITNASEAIGEISGVVTLSTGVMDCDEAYLQGVVGDSESHPVGQYVFVEVSDTGCGMDPDTMARIFDPFFTTKFTGRGLGLAAVMGIVRGHKGALRVYSEKGRGTTFKILFPAYSQPPKGLEALEVVATDWHGKGLILLADDEESIRSMGRHLLERAGFEVLTASDGGEAVDLYQRHHEVVRLVVLDMTMPHMDGEACFRELRRIAPEVRVIMTSGYNEQDVVERFVGKGLAGFVQKPYKAADLLPKIREALGE
jgi:two-component system cell cycle sensor histidine kinase/response regulator CckA